MNNILRALMEKVENMQEKDVEKWNKGRKE